MKQALVVMRVLGIAVQLAMAQLLRSPARTGDSAMTAPTTNSLNTNTYMAVRFPRVLQDYEFVPLSCNSNYSIRMSDDASSCRSWSSVFGTNEVHTERLVVPCGECVFLDVPRLQLLDGLDIHGMLRVLEVPLELETTVLVVQGMLEMTATGKAVDGIPLVHVTMVGENDERFMPVYENSNACGGGECVAGKKSITVAGGQVNSTSVSLCSSILLGPNTPWHDDSLVSCCIIFQIESQWTAQQHANMGAVARRCR